MRNPVLADQCLRVPCASLDNGMFLVIIMVAPLLPECSQRKGWRGRVLIMGIFFIILIIIIVRLARTLRSMAWAGRSVASTLRLAVMSACRVFRAGFAPLLALAALHFRLLQQPPPLRLLLANASVFHLILSDKSLGWRAKDPLILAKLADPFVFRCRRMVIIL